MAKFASALIAAALWSAPVSVDVFVPPPMRDEIAGTALFEIDLRSSVFEYYMIEDYLRFECHSDGGVTARLHWGGAYTGGYLGGPMILKLDDAAPIKIEGDDLQSSAVSGPLFAQILSAKKLLINVPGFAINGQIETWRIDLKGIEAVGGPASEFGKQCAKAIGEPRR